MASKKVLQTVLGPAFHPPAPSCAIPTSSLKMPVRTLTPRFDENGKMVSLKVSERTYNRLYPTSFESSSCLGSKIPDPAWLDAA